MRRAASLGVGCLLILQIWQRRDSIYAARIYAAPYSTQGTLSDGRMDRALLGEPDDLDMWLPQLRNSLTRKVQNVRSSTAVSTAPMSPRRQFRHCNGNGRFDVLTGTCFCRVGWAGDDCTVPRIQRCNDARPVCNGTSKNVQDLVAGVDRPNCHEWTLVSSRCAGQCDERQNRCVCGPRARYPFRHMHKCELKEMSAVHLPWMRPGWDSAKRVEPWQLWAYPNNTPPWFEAQVGVAAVETLWQPIRQLPLETRRALEELAWCNRPPDATSQRRARRLNLPDWCVRGQQPPLVDVLPCAPRCASLRSSVRTDTSPSDDACVTSARCDVVTVCAMMVKRA